MDNDLEQWCLTKNQEFESNATPSKTRPLLAFQEYCREKKISCGFNSKLANSITAWFMARSRPEAHMIGSVFVGSFFYQGSFWPVSMPLVLGQVRLEAVSALQPEMSDSVTSALFQDRSALRLYLLTWADCLDWAFGFGDIKEEDTTCSRLLRAGADELRGAACILNGFDGRNAAYQQCRMAIEKSMKALLAERQRHDEDELRRQFGHQLVELATACGTETQQLEFTESIPLLRSLRSVSDRYSGRTIADGELWTIYRLALTICSTVARELTDRDMKQRVLGKIGPA